MFTANDVKELREKTGAGMLDCKKALDETQGNMEEAIKWLREKGISKAEKKASRIAAEGLTHAASNDNVAALIEVNCETDFVAKNEEFKNMLFEIVKTLFDNDVTTVEEANKLTLANGATIEEEIISKTATIGEKISFRRFIKFVKNDDEVFGIYSHMGGRITSIVTLKGNDRDVARDIAMHVAAMNPLYVRSSEVPSEAIEKEKEIYKEQAMNEGKPLEIAEKMVEGRIKKYYKEVCLVEQPFVKNPDLTVEQYAKQNNCEILNMVRYEVGEGMEKRQENFAEEVQNQING